MKVTLLARRQVRQVGAPWRNLVHPQKGSGWVAQVSVSFKDTAHSAVQFEACLSKRAFPWAKQLQLSRGRGGEQKVAFCAVSGRQFPSYNSPDSHAGMT